MRERRFQPATGFVIMPFDRQPRTVRLFDAMTQAADGYEYLDIHRFESSGGQELFTAIAAQIRHADFALADFTLQEHGAPNGNVLTEAGIAIGCGTPLYVLARAADYGSLSECLPSDWKGHLIEVFADPASEWDAQFVDLFGRILTDLGLPRDRAVERARGSSAETLRWLTRFVDALRATAVELYESDWTIGEPGGLPSRYTFRLTRGEHDLEAGAFLGEWQRGAHPLAIRHGEVSHAIALPAPLDEVTTPAALDAAVAAIDGVVATVTPDARRPTALASAVTRWGFQVRFLANALAAQDGLTLEAPAVWTPAGFLGRCRVDGTPYRLVAGVDLGAWERHGQTPFWIAVEADRREAIDALRLPRAGARAEMGRLLVPVRARGNVSDPFRHMLSRCVEACVQAGGQTER